MSIFKRAGPLAKQESELADRRRRRDALITKLDAAQVALDRANAERRRLLIEVDAPAAQDVTAAENACRDAADRLAGIDDAMRALAEQIEGAEQALTAQRERVERDLAAAEAERRAATIDAAGAKLARALETVSAAYLEFQKQVHEGGVTESGYGAGINYSAQIYAASVLRCGLEGLLPGVPAVMQLAGSVQGEFADATARRLQSDRLRHHADALRSGSVPVGQLQTPSDVVYRAPPALERTQLVLSESIIFLDERAKPIRIIAGGVEVPVPVAEKAVELGIGFSLQSHEGQKILSAIRAEPAATADWRDIGVNLWQMAQADRLSGAKADGDTPRLKLVAQ